MKTLDLFIFIDALGWEIVRRRPFLPDIFPVQRRCETVFGYSSTCDPTILTGCSPVEHGHFAFFVRAQKERPFTGFRWLGWLPHRLAGYHRLRNVVSRQVAARKGYTGYFQLYSVPFARLPYLDYTEKRDIYEPGGIHGGQETIFAHWERSGRKWMRSDWRRGDNWNVAEFREALQRGEIELGYLFTAGPDGAMHVHGVDSPEARACIDALADGLRGLWETAQGRYDAVRFYAFSDHGMARTERVSDLMLRWERLGFRFGRDYTAVWDSTMARFWFHGSEAVRRRAVDWLGAQPDGRVVPDAELDAWGCLFPERTYGEVFYLLPAGTIFVPSFMNQSWVAGMHGYDPAHPDSAGAWLSSAAEAPEPRGLADIHGVMRWAAARPGAQG